MSIDLIDSITADITFTSDSVGQYQYFFIDGGAADVNVNADTWTISNLVTDALNGGTIADDGSKTVDGFGVFNQTTKQTDGYNDRATTISFTLTDTSGTWLSSSSVLAANSSGDFAAAHIGVCDTVANPTCASTPGAAATGFASGNVEVTTHGGIPEPASWTLMITGIGLAGTMFRLRRRAAAA